MFAYLHKWSWKTLFALAILLMCIIGFMLEWIRIFSYSDPWSGLLMVSTFFTIHANFFVFVSILLFLLKIRNRHTDRFAFITTIDILITCIVFFTLLLPFMVEISAVQIILHGVIPPLYILYFFIAYPTTLSRQNVWISLIHPMLYFLFVFTIYHPIYSAHLVSLFPDEIGPYVYPFLHSTYFEHGMWGMLSTNFLLLFPATLALSCLVLSFKLYLDNQSNHEKNKDASN